MTMKTLINFFKRETVFCVSLLLAVISAFFVLPDAAYLTYPDYRTLALLFCLMIIVAGFQALGLFSLLGESLLKKAGSLRNLSFVLVFLCFFSSMVITNDVALITFVPFTILVFRMIGREERILKLVVMETIAANLGSMATPIGNPQNLYLYSVSGIGIGEFALAVLPYTGIAFLLLAGVLLAERDEPLGKQTLALGAGAEQRRMFPALLPFLVLLGLCLLVVLHALPYLPVLICTAVVILAVNRRLFRSVDYFLLLTFLCFFVFIGNMKRIPQISTLLTSAVSGRELLAGILTSQVISNVPAAILLAGFTDRFTVLLTAVNLGGLGTLIASLASLISFKFFAKEFPRQKGVFLKIFTIWNVVFLVILTAAALVLS